ncbi:MAG: hypothetical protein LIO95_11455 [Clostridiales bacterium]|nr:hypothetical protein [Clostridiales bacterium]
MESQDKENLNEELEQSIIVPTPGDDDTSSFDDTVEMVSSLSSAFSNLGNALAKSLSAICAENLSFIRESSKAMLEGLRQILSQVALPHYSEVQKQALITSYIEWGKYGWSMIPTSTFDFMDTPPCDRESANKQAMTFCKKADMEKLFDMFQERHINKADLEEAIICFHQRLYKSCALLLFSMIDAKLIRLQRKQDLNGKMRNTGKRAAKDMYDKVEALANKDPSFPFAWYLRAINVYECICTYFAYGGDFRKQPDIGNRNFIDHGMYTKRVRKRDCIQLFLIYYNLLCTLEFLETK